MADEDTGAEAEGQQHQDETPDVDSKIAAAIEEAKKSIADQFKSEIAGLNRRNTELEGELESEKKARMSEKERAEYEREQKDKEIAEREQKLAAAERASTIASGIADRKLDPDVRKLMTTPTTAEEFQTWANNYEALQASYIERQVNERLAGRAPESSGNGKRNVALETFDDGRKASEEDFVAYLTKTVQE